MISKNKILFIDGMARSGKSALCQIIVGLSNMEHVDLNYNFEYIFSGLVKKKIEQTFAKEFINSFLARYTYDKILGRNINLRKDDFTGIYNFYDPKVYLDRIRKNIKFSRYDYIKTTVQKKIKHDPVLKELNSNLRYFPIQSHYLMENFSTLKKLNINFKLIRIERHPVDNIYSYFKRGRGKLVKNNKYKNYYNASYFPRKTSFCIPWYLDISEKKYLVLGEIGRCVFSHVYNLEKIKKVKPNNKILNINFDNFCKNPKKEINKICTFLNVKKKPKLPLFVKRANFPRIIDHAKRNSKYNFLVKKINNLELKKSLDRQIKFFEMKKN